MGAVSKKVSPNDFLSKMKGFTDLEGDDPAPAMRPVPVQVKPVVEKSAAPVAKPQRAAPARKRPAKPLDVPTNRSSLKHIGAYLMPEDVEKFSLLKARLGMDNSQLVELAINTLYKQESAKRKFGDM